MAKIIRYAGVSYATEEHRALGVLPADRWWQLNAAARMQSGLWGALLLVQGSHSTMGEKRGEYPSMLR